VIYLVRHGESEWNVAQRTQGQTRHPQLTEHGRAQAQAAARALLADIGSTPVSCVVSSDLVRAVQTAEIVAGVLGTRMCVDARLREQSLGSFEGLSYAESFAAGSAFDWSDPDLRVGGGESLREMATRMTTALSDFADELITTGAIVVVSHGDAIRAALLAARVGALPGAGTWVDVPNGSVAVLDGTNGARWLAVDLPVNGR
jgi:broad specificity phosphatase PhoE